MKLISSLLLLFFLPVFLFCLQPSPAFSQEEWLYTVQEDDNLWKIGKQNLESMRYWRKLVELNKIEDPFHLQPGSTIRIPFEWMKKGASAARLVAVSGEATVVRAGAGAKTQAAVNMFLWHNDRIQTAALASATLQFADGSEVLVQESSELVVGELMCYGDTGMTETRLFLKSGRTHQKVIPASGPGSRFEIATPSAIAAARGTEYRIGTALDGSSYMEVLEGSVHIESAGETNILKKGYGSVAFPDKKPLPPKKLLPPPEFAEMPPEIVRTPFLITVDPVTGAKSYRLQIAAEKNFKTLLFDKVFPGKNLWGPDLPNGLYFLRINGIDEDGLEGFYTIRPFKMAAHPVPPVALSPTVEEVVENGQPTFRWSQRKGTEQYHFQLADNDNFTSLLVDVPDFKGVEYRYQEQLPPGVYHWRLASVDYSGHEGPYSDPQQFRCPPPSPDMSAARLDKKEMVYRWAGLKAKVRYRLQIFRDDNSMTPLVDKELVEPEFNLEALTPGTYHIKVATMTSDGFLGPYSPPQIVIVESPPPHPLAVAGSVLLVIGMTLL